MLVFRDINVQLDDPAEQVAADSFLDYLALLDFDLRLYMPQLMVGRARCHLLPVARSLPQNSIGLFGSVPVRWPESRFGGCV